MDCGARTCARSALTVRATQKYERSGVLIKTTLEADNLRLGTDERLELNCESDLNAMVTIEQANTKGKFTCTALGDVTPPAKVAMALTGNKPQTVPRVDQYLKAAEHRLSSHLSRTLRILMWRRGISVAYNRPVFTGAFWSLDGQQWNRIYGLLQGSSSVEPQEPAGPVPPEIVAAVGALAANGQDEPLARQLLREAWAQKDQSYRSALVLAIAAAEVGLKHCISALVPDARWLVENNPTPPLHKMLTEYLPLLPVRARLTGKTLVPSDDLLHEIETGVGLRNSVVHLGHVKMTAEKLDRILRAVSDLLWILDVYQGHKWAIRYIDPAVLNNWKPS
jgi:hypothetical protein